MLNRGWNKVHGWHQGSSMVILNFTREQSHCSICHSLNHSLPTMFGSPFSSALLLLSIISAIRAQLTVQSDWVFPQSPDYSTTVNIGSTVYFRWTTNLKNQFATYLPNGNSSRVDVWVTGETISNGYHKLACAWITELQVYNH